MMHNLDLYDTIHYSRLPMKERIQVSGSVFVQCCGSAKLTTLNSDGVLHQKSHISTPELTEVS